MNLNVFSEVQEEYCAGGFRALRRRFWRQAMVMAPFFLVAIIPLFVAFLFTQNPIFLLLLLVATLAYGWWRRDAM